MKILFIGDIFGNPGIIGLGKHLKKIINKEKIDFVIAQGENVSGRKGLVEKDYIDLKKFGVNAFTMGNHIWAKKDIYNFINNKDIIRPYNVNQKYLGEGTRIFKIKGKTLRISSFLGIAFNELNTNDWKEKFATNFFDAFDKIEKFQKTDYHLIDFHGETTSEKNVFAQYIDGKASALLGTHTHVQTNDARTLPKGSVFITDVGMTGPINAAIGADWNSVYQKMRYNSRSEFKVSNNSVELNAVIVSLNKNDNKIQSIKKSLN